MPAARPTTLLLRTELDAAWMAWMHRPGEQLSVLDNASDLSACMQRVGANATTTFAMIRPAWDPAQGRFVADVDAEQVRKQAEVLRANGAWGTAYLGEFNNPWFLEYPAAFVDAVPEAWMQDPSGKRVELARDARGRPVVIPVTSLDDPTVWDLATEVIRRDGPVFLATGRVTQWVVGTEHSYPELFGLPASDFRPASWRHFIAWLRREGWPLDASPERVRDPADREAQAAWYAFREAAMADRAAHYMAAFLEVGPGIPALYPTHNSLHCRDQRRRLGQPAADMAGATDGLELGHITIDDDDERLNPLVNAHFGSFGKPVIAPRLANKTLDPSIVGGGRSFTPHMLRRLVYESLGQGIWHIGPIHWTSVLHDGDWHIKGTPAEEACRQVFSEIKAAAPILEGMARLQPAVGLYVADDTWRRWWDPRWTMLFQDSLGAHWNMSVVSDATVGAPLASRTPLLISIDNTRVSASARRALAEYCRDGGTVLAVGSLAESDERARAIPWAPLPGGVHLLGQPPQAQRRKLTLEFHCGEGSIKVPEEASPVSLVWIEEAVRRIAPAVLLRPAIVSPAPGAGSLNVYALTDRCSIALAVVNMSPVAVEADVHLAPAITSREARWECRDAITRELLASSAGARLTVGGHGTRLLWFAPSAERHEATAAAEEARAALRRWDEAGFDTAFLHAARNALAAGTPDSTKLFTLSRALLGSFALRPRAEWVPGGGLAVSADAQDADGNPVGDATVTVMVTPGDCTRRALAPLGRGRYARTFRKDELPFQYDARAGRYERTQGPLRLVLGIDDASARVGGSLVVVPAHHV